MNLLKRWRKRHLEANSCSEELGRIAQSNPAVVWLGYDYQRDTLEFEYDSTQMEAAQAQRIADDLTAELASRAPTCALRSGEGLCEDCLEVERHGKKWISPGGEPIKASFKGSLLEVQQPTRPNVPVHRVVRRVRAFESIAPWWQRRPLWEPALSGLTLCFLLFGLIAHAQGLPDWLFKGSMILAYVAGGYFGVLDAYNTLKNHRLDVNFLMVAAALGAAVVDEAPEGATLLFLFSLSNSLQSFALARSRRAIRSLMALKPDTATLLRDGIPQEVSADSLEVDDLVLVKPGERVPTDGVVIKGESHVDQSPITGESVPVAKEPGMTVYAGTLNGNGVLEVKVEQPQELTLLHRIMALVEQAQEQKARTQRWLEAFEQRYALVVIGGSILIVPLLLLFGWTFADALYRSMTLLVVASPCALVISTPATLLSALANAARHGVLFKGGEPLERLAEVKAIAFDKTGTLTEGRLKLTDLIPLSDVEGGEGRNGCDLPQPIASTPLYQLLLDVESLSEHPLAQALTAAAQAQGLQAQPIDEFRAIPGKGVQARRQGKAVLIGNLRLFRDELGYEPPETLQEILNRLQSEGKTVMILYEDGQWLGVAAVSDTVRPTALSAVQALKAMNVHPIVMLTGDSERIAKTIAEQVGIERVYPALLPDQKLEVLDTLQNEAGSVAMVGDGVNDAPALAAATVGLAMGAGTDVALETADVALIGNDLQNVPYAVALSRHAMRVLKQNLAFAVAVIAVLITLTFATELRMPMGVVGHEGSTLIVVLNGLRLLGFRHT